MTDTQTEDKKDVVPPQYRDQYKATGGSNGDFIAVELSRIAKDGIDSLNSVKTENGIETDRWSDKNNGMQRMNLANVLRGKYLKGETITILGKQYNVEHQLKDFTGEVKDTKKSMREVAVYLELKDDERTVNLLRKLLFVIPQQEEEKKRKAEEREAAKAEREAAKAEKAKEREAAKQKKAEEKAAKDAEKQKKAEEKAAAKEAETAE